jgi:hypothetical protein
MMTPNSCDTGLVAAEKILDPMVAARASNAKIAPIPSFFFIGQFCACSGSSAPSNSTTYSSRSGSCGGYGLPAPRLGSGLSVRLLDSVCERREATCAVPTVPACWLRCVSMRRMASGLRSVGCRCKMLPLEACDVTVVARSRAGTDCAVRISSRRALCVELEVAELEDEEADVRRDKGATSSSSLGGSVATASNMGCSASCCACSACSARMRSWALASFLCSSAYSLRNWRRGSQAVKAAGFASASLRSTL